MTTENCRRSAEAVSGASAKVFVASNSLWRRQLGADPQILGKTYLLDGEPYTLIGVLPADFHFPGTCDIWLPIGTLGARLPEDRVSHQFWMIGRLRKGFTVVQAQMQLNGIQHQFARAYPDTDANWLVTVKPLLEEFVGNVRTSLWVLLAAAAFVLLIACTNVIIRCSPAPSPAKKSLPFAERLVPPAPDFCASRSRKAC